MVLIRPCRSSRLAQRSDGILRLPRTPNDQIREAWATLPVLRSPANLEAGLYPSPHPSPSGLGAMHRTLDLQRHHMDPHRRRLRSSRRSLALEMLPNNPTEPLWTKRLSSDFRRKIVCAERNLPRRVRTAIRTRQHRSHAATAVRTRNYRNPPKPPALQRQTVELESRTWTCS